LKDDLAKAAFPKGNTSLDDLLSKQRSNNGKAGIGFVTDAKKKKKNNNKKKAKPTQARDKAIVDSDATKGKTMSQKDFHPNYVLMRNYYGEVYAKYVGPLDGYVAWSIWVPKTLVTNKRGPIEKWVPKI
jgi:hypothetical protein